MLCLRFVHLVRQGRAPDSAMNARLDTGGWLALTRQGLSPCKRRQAFLARERKAEVDAFSAFAVAVQWISDSSLRTVAYGGTMDLSTTLAEIVSLSVDERIRLVE